eukprot:GGOE01013644.1.p1 GENE.GGOE01013644.1~~GGOE01013644.1.p1  ORF type:complete len:168 (-),score=33.15 GGOE01013644.1:137-640(-)
MFRILRNVASTSINPWSMLHRAPFHTTFCALATVCQKVRKLNANRQYVPEHNWPLNRNRPQRKGVVLKVYDTSPRKPNSGKRRIAVCRVFVHRVRETGYKVYKKIHCYIPGVGAHNLQKHSEVLICPKGRMQDTPAIKYKVIRGALDLKGCDMRRRRSKFGAKKPKK